MNVQLHLGDCLDVMRGMPDGCVDAVVTDPPYGIAYQSAWRTDPLKRHRPIANDAQPFVWFLPEAARLLRPGGALLCFCRWDTREAFRLAIGWAGLQVRSHVVWDREAHGMGDLTAQFAPQHDDIWFATKGQFRFPGERPKSVVRALRVSGASMVHPNEKPVDLMRQLVDAVTPPGGVVLDPFLGSGATGCAAVATNRSFVGIEMDEERFAIAEDRIAHARGETPVDADQPALPFEVSA